MNNHQTTLANGPTGAAAAANATWITCVACSFRFDPALHPSCATCPFHQGCSMACCPNCGASNINPAESRLANLLKRWMGDKHA